MRAYVPFSALAGSILGLEFCPVLCIVGVVRFFFGGGIGWSSTNFRLQTRLSFLLCCAHLYGRDAERSIASHPDEAAAI